MGYVVLTIRVMNRAFLAEDFFVFFENGSVHPRGGMDFGRNPGDAMKQQMSRPVQRSRQARASQSRVGPEGAAVRAGASPAPDNHPSGATPSAVRQALYRLRQHQAI